MDLDASICWTAKALPGTLVWEMIEPDCQWGHSSSESSVSKVALSETLSGTQQRGEGIAPWRFGLSYLYSISPRKKSRTFRRLWAKKKDPFKWNERCSDCWTCMTLGWPKSTKRDVGHLCFKELPVFKIKNLYLPSTPNEHRSRDGRTVTGWLFQCQYGSWIQIVD